MNEYSLINSKAIREHCKKIGHKFNTEELAVLIYRNKTMSIDEKIGAYKELINDYPDMPVIERINCKHYDSVKDMIQGEIERLESEIKVLLKDEEDVVYSYTFFYDTRYRSFKEGKNEYRDVYKTFNEIQELIDQDIIDDEEKEIVRFVVSKRNVSKYNKYLIKAEYILDNKRKLKMVNIYNCNFVGECQDIGNICLNIPTPFKKGDLLIANSYTPSFERHTLSYNRFPFVLENLCTWNSNFQKLLDKGNYDYSDMQGAGYLISKAGSLYGDNVFDYDSWEYCDRELQGNERLLKGVSNLMKNEIGIDLFLQGYEYIKSDNKSLLNMFTAEGLQLAGLTAKDIHILEVKKEYDNRAEQVILGNLLIENQEVIDQVINIINVNDFENSNHKMIYEAILDVYNETNKININTIKQKLNNIVDLEFLVDLIDVASEDPNVKYYIESMKNRDVTMERVELKHKKNPVINSKGQSIDTTYCILDLETTGFLPAIAKITEVVIMKVQNGQVIDQFSCFVNPEKPIPPRVVEVTNITDDMVKDAETIDKVMPKILEFLGDSVIVAHNVGFDIGFLKQNAKNLGYEFDYTFIDTLILSKILFPDFRSYKLDKILETLEIEHQLEDRTMDYARNTYILFNIILDKIKDRGIKIVEDFNEIVLHK